MHPMLHMSAGLPHPAPMQTSGARRAELCMSSTEYLSSLSAQHADVDASDLFHYRLLNHETYRRQHPLFL